MDEQSVGASQNQWWRWPLMPFAAVVGAALGSFLFGLMQRFGLKFHGGFAEDGWMYRYILPVLASAAFGWLYVWIACHVAPRGKVIAGTVMTTILFLVYFVSMAFAWLSPTYPAGAAIAITIGSLASLIAAVTALIQVHAEQS